jgi:hypothetical protein
LGYQLVAQALLQELRRIRMAVLQLVPEGTPCHHHQRRRLRKHRVQSKPTRLGIPW